MIRVTGLVQGVGFRPFIHRLATRHHLHGWVENRNDCVLISVNSNKQIINQFCADLIRQAPAASSIQEISVEKDGAGHFSAFEVRESRDVTNEVTEISPDIAVCEECLADMRNQPHRIGYPLINCSHCGPRFSIIRDLPYDRSQTTMSGFEMCPECQREYSEIKDRRYHAQPVSCNRCGPVYSLDLGGSVTSDPEKILQYVAAALNDGKLLAIKGTGGFHLACDALDPGAVGRLREIKRRNGKPFAVMFRNVDCARAYVRISSREEEVLTSWRRPILLLRKIKACSEGIADGLNRLGVMLPYMPFHHLLFERVDTPALVMTSGNISDEPIAISEPELERRFGRYVDGVVSYNREIHNRIDDSVAAVTGDDLLVMRRARGYAPAPIRTGFVLEGILGTGAELTGSFCIGKGRNAIMSQYTGDLSNAGNFNFYTEAYHRFCRLFRFTPHLVVSDLHPDYMSTRFAEQLSRENPAVRHIRVQHHHAHLASVMLEAGLDEEVIGFSFDGNGLGTDGHGWGGEVMRADFHHFDRLYHFEYMPLPGGDAAVREPWRMGISYLYALTGERVSTLGVPLVHAIGKASIDRVISMIQKGVNVPAVSSAGRLFDAVAAITGLSYTSGYTAQAPMLLESAINESEKGSYLFEINGQQVSFLPLIEGVVGDLQRKTDTGTISARFHNTLVELIIHLSRRIRSQTGLEKVVLAGGSFQNSYLVQKVKEKLAENRFDVYISSMLPVNDQGIAAGQAVLGAHMWKKEKEAHHA